MRRKVIERAARRCEYCLIHEDDEVFRHEVDHIVAEKHRGATNSSNLSYACFPCNRNKGSDLASLSEQGVLTRFFNPRTDQWSVRFRIEKDRLAPLTIIGQVTEQIFDFNAPERCARRRGLQAIGRYPVFPPSPADSQ